MAAMSFNEFISSNPRARELFERHFSWKYQFDFYRSLERALAALIYCARHSEKISYANLATVAGVDEHYIRSQSLGNVMGTMLEIIGRYCQTLPNAPKLTSLCVGQVTGLPGDGYFEVFDRGYLYATSSDRMDHLLALYEFLGAYPYWNTIKLEHKVKVAEMKDITVPWGDFSISVAPDPINAEKDLIHSNKLIKIYSIATVWVSSIGVIVLAFHSFGWLYVAAFAGVVSFIYAIVFLLFLEQSRRDVIRSKVDQDKKAKEEVVRMDAAPEKSVIKTVDEVVKRSVNKSVSDNLTRMSFQETATAFRIRAFWFRVAVFCILVLVIGISVTNFLVEPLCFFRDVKCEFLSRMDLENAKFIWIILQTLVPLSVLMIYCCIMERRYTHLFLRYHEISMGISNLEYFMGKDYDKETKAFFAKKYFGHPFDPNKSREKDISDMIAPFVEPLKGKKNS